MTRLTSNSSNSASAWDARLHAEALRIQASCLVEPARVEALADELIILLRSGGHAAHSDAVEKEAPTQLVTRVLRRVLEPICGVNAANSLLQSVLRSLPVELEQERPNASQETLNLVMVKASSLVGSVFGINAAHMVEAVVRKVSFELAAGR